MTQVQRGFTLIETVIAFAIVSVSLSALYQAFGQTLRRDHQNQLETLAALHLASVHDRAGVESPLFTGVTEGQLDNRFHWRIEVRPESTQAATSVSTPLVKVTSTVSWQQDNATHSVSVRGLEPAPSARP